MVINISVKIVDIGTLEKPEVILELTFYKKFLFIKYKVVYREVHGEIFLFKKGKYLTLKDSDKIKDQFIFFKKNLTTRS